MAFAEKIKLKVKRRAAFRCCRCQSIGVEVHHILPQSDGGSDAIDNAAPLCAKCHNDFGANPLKRKEITEMRNWWYEKVSDKYSVSDPRYQSIEMKLDELLNAVKNPAPPMDAIKSAVRDFVELYLEGMNTQNVQKIVSAVMNIEKPPFLAGSPCQMSGQPCPAQACRDGIMDIDPTQEGVICNKCRLFIGAVY